MLFAQVTEMVGTIGTGVGFGALVWYLITKHLPRVQASFQATLVKQEVEHTKQIQYLREDCKENLDRVHSIKGEKK